MTELNEQLDEYEKSREQMIKNIIALDGAIQALKRLKESIDVKSNSDQG